MGSIAFEHLEAMLDARWYKYGKRRFNGEDLFIHLYLDEGYPFFFRRGKINLGGIVDMRPRMGRPDDFTDVDSRNPNVDAGKHTRCNPKRGPFMVPRNLDKFWQIRYNICLIFFRNIMRLRSAHFGFATS